VEHLTQQYCVSRSGVGHSPGSDMTPERLIDVAVIARHFQVTDQSVRNWIRAGKVHAIRRTPWGRYLIAPAEFARLKTLLKESKDATL